MEIDLAIEMLSSCALCGEVNRELGGAAVMFQVRSPDGHAGTFSAHASCVIRAMHPTVRALLDTTPPIPEGAHPEAFDLISAEQHSTHAVTVSLYPPDHLDRQSPELRTFLADAQSRLAPGVDMTAGPDNQAIPPGMHVPIVTFYFEPEQLPDPMWTIREWAMGHPLVRLIEVESHMPDARAT